MKEYLTDDDDIYCEFCGTKEGKIKMIQDFGVCEKCERGGRV